jgi:hypothetical protein
MPEASTGSTPELKNNLSANLPLNLEEEIRRRAYELFERRGCIPGYENEDWLVAEREVMARYNLQQSA